MQVLGAGLSVLDFASRRRPGLPAARAIAGGTKRHNGVRCGASKSAWMSLALYRRGRRSTGGRSCTPGRCAGRRNRPSLPRRNGRRHRGELLAHLLESGRHGPCSSSFSDMPCCTPGLSGCALFSAAQRDAGARVCRLALARRRRRRVSGFGTVGMPDRRSDCVSRRCPVQPQGRRAASLKTPCGRQAASLKAQVASGSDLGLAEEKNAADQLDDDPP
jgi:hypothetical protein